MLDLYVEILKQLLKEELYPADIADLCFSIMPGDKGIILKFSGYNQKLHLLLEAVINHMAEFENSLTPSIFEALKEVQGRYYYNSCLKPKRLGQDLRFSLLTHVHWNAVDKHAATSRITVSMVKAFARHFVEHLYIKSLVQGNISEQQAIDACKNIVDILKCSPLLPNKYPQLRVMQIPLGEHCCRVKSFNSQDPNSSVTNYYQSGPISIKSLCIVDLLMLLMEEPVFDVLRTKEQLGYHVCSSVRDTFGILGFSVTVNCQAGKHRFSKILKNMKEKELEEVRSSLIKLKQLSDIHLKEEVSRNWNEISSGDYLFDRLEREVSCIKDIKMPEIRKWYNDHVLCGNKSNLRKLSVQVTGAADAGETPQTQEQQPPSHSRVHGHSKTRQPLQKCSSIHNGLTVELSLQFVAEGDTDGHTKKHFITDIEDFKNGLFIYPISRIWP
ncbi:hypothetical protein B7P43_G17280 [Cryptotermes secundus]|uniref:Peptidase M16 C-terminal domain-containing protein n=1 Tax=Cryptotermes secundus TaxID=105785 RepID=A0A2J7R973_9NEOP|nr:hypothetical protein B7P43_G17280 [Cryptotermes secundus]